MSFVEALRSPLQPAIQRGGRGVRPTLNLDFGTGELDPRITFTRASSATYFDSTGVLQRATYNLLTYSVWSGASGGSPGTAPTSWTIGFGTGAQTTVVTSIYGSVDGSIAVRFDADATERIMYQQSVSVTSGVQYALSAELEQVSGSIGDFLLVTAGTATVTQNTFVTNPNTAGRKTILFTATATGTVNIRVGVGTSAGVSGTCFATVSRPQLEAASTAGPYYATTNAANGAPRFDYDPTTLAARGLLIEEQRTNSIRNNTMQGAVAGTPGTLPTNWARFTSGTAATAVIGTGTESGISYVDVRFTGANTDGISFFMDGTTGHTAANGQTWTGSSYYRLVAGAITNATVNHAVYEANSSGTQLAVTSTSLAAVTSAALSSQRISATRTNNNASTAEEQLAIIVAGTGNFDFTLRIGLPQLEQGAFATSVIPTTTAAATRLADSAVMTGSNFSPWYNQSEGTWYSDVTFGNGIGSVAQAAYSVSDGGEVNRLISYRTGIAAYVFDENPGGGSIAVGASANNTRYLAAVAYKTDDMALSINGAAAITDTSVTISTKSQINIGDRATGSRALNGHIRSIRYYPTRLPNATLQALTA